MNKPFATIEDVTALWRPLSVQEQERTAALLPMLSNQLRMIAKGYGRDLDQMIAEEPAYADVAKSVIISAVIRVFGQTESGAAVTQETQTALGYSYSATYATPISGLANLFLRADLKALGLTRQRIGAREIYDTNPWDNDQTV